MDPCLRPVAVVLLLAGSGSLRHSLERREGRWVFGCRLLPFLPRCRCWLLLLAVIATAEKSAVRAQVRVRVAERSRSWRASLRDEPFLVMAYPGPPREHVSFERYREIADAGIDVIVPGNGSWDGPSNLKALDLAAKVGLRVIVTDLRILPWHIEDRVKIDQRNIEGVAADYHGHPALLGYLICDEPNADYFDELASTARRLRLADPKHFPLINLFPSYASPMQLGFEDYPAYVRAFVETVNPDVLSYDHYPLRNPQADETDWFGDLAVICDASRKAGIPFWICLQCEGVGESLRIPNRTEILWQASTALAYGARGVVWFTYWTPSATQEIPPDDEGRPYLPSTHIGGMLSRDGKRTPRYDHVREVNRFLHKAGRALRGWNNAHVAHWNNGRLIGDGQSPCITLGGKESRAVVGTFSRGRVRRVVVANESYVKSASFTVKWQPGWRLSQVVATLDAEGPTEGNGPSQWKLAPGGCVLIECTRQAR